jgi:hypothetical protein
MEGRIFHTEIFHQAMATDPKTLPMNHSLGPTPL